jgi:hypothetical protein
MHNLLEDSIKDKGPSISDIMNDDLTGATQPKSARRSRTEDDLPGSRSQARTNNEKADLLTEELMFYLMMECRNNLFPKRVNPERLKQQTIEEIEKYEKEQQLKKESELNQEEVKSGNFQEEDEDDLPQRKMAIKTNPESITEYMKTLFSKIEGNEEDFIANLSSPLQRSPLEILMHLQNTQYELESYEQLPYQQSVITVDIYLDIERTRKRTEEMELKETLDKAKEIHEEEKSKQVEEKKEGKKDGEDHDNQLTSNENKPQTLVNIIFWEV